jgi:hypothetical protein
MGLAPAISIIGALALLIEIAGTSPAMTGHDFALLTANANAGLRL